MNKNNFLAELFFPGMFGLSTKTTSSNDIGEFFIFKTRLPNQTVNQVPVNGILGSLPNRALFRQFIYKIIFPEAIEVKVCLVVHHFINQGCFKSKGHVNSIF